MVREETFRHTVYTKFEAIGVGGRGDGVGPGLLLSGGIGGHCGDELAGDERKAIEIFQDEIEVVTLGRLGDACLACQTCRLQFTRQGGFSLAEELGRKRHQRQYIAQNQ